MSARAGRSLRRALRALGLAAAGLSLWVACPGPQPPEAIDPGPYAMRPDEPEEAVAEEAVAEGAMAAGDAMAAGTPGGAGRAAGAAASAGDPSSSPAHEPAGEPVTEPAAEVRAGAPATLSLELPGRVRRQVRRLGGDRATAAAPEPLRLTVTGVPASEAAVALRAFVNLPDAGPDTPLDSPHYAGTFPLPPAGAAQKAGDAFGGTPDYAAAGGSFLVDLARVLAALPPEDRLADGGVLLTLVAVPLRAGEELPADLALPIGGVHLDRGEPGPPDDP